MKITQEAIIAIQKGLLALYPNASHCLNYRDHYCDAPSCNTIEPTPFSPEGREWSDLLRENGIEPAGLYRTWKKMESVLPYKVLPTRGGSLVAIGCFTVNDLMELILLAKGLEGDKRNAEQPAQSPPPDTLVA